MAVPLNPEFNAVVPVFGQMLLIFLKPFVCLFFFSPSFAWSRYFERHLLIFSLLVFFEGQ